MLIAALGILFFYHLGEDEVSSDAEARVLLTAQEMNRSQTWVIPTVGGQGRWEKPPFYVWSVKVASFFTEGEVTPMAARLPGAVAMSLLVLLAAWWAYEHFKTYPRNDAIEVNAEGFALLSGLILATTPKLMGLARSGSNDSIFALFCFAAIYCLGQSFEVRRSFFAGRSWKQWILAAYFLIGLAMLTKGPAAFLFVLIPYTAMCWSYKLRRPDPIHLVGLVLALVVGGWWYALAVIVDPEAARVFLSELLTKRFGPHAENHRPFYFYFALIFKSYSPWIFLAAAMVYRNLRLGDRTPTLVTWSCALLGGIIWLSLVGSKRDQYFLPVAPFIMLLAGDALMRWDFDSRLGAAFRVLIRLLRYALIIVGIPLSILLGSELGILLTLVALLICILFAVHRRRTTYVYAVWERTVHGAALLVLVLGIYESVYVRDYLPRTDLRNRMTAFMNQVTRHLPEDASVYIYDDDDSALMSYYLGRLPPIIYNVGELEDSENPDTYLISDEDVDELVEKPRLVPLVLRTRDDGSRIRSGFFKYIPESEYPEPLGWEDRFRDLPPLRLAVLGDAGDTDYDDQRELARELDDTTDEWPLNGILSLGDALTEGSRHDRIDFYSSFERPYRNQLRDGVPFYGILGEDDQEIAPLVVRYPLLQMHGQRYYIEQFHGGMVDYFALDSFLLAGDGEESETHWEWIEEKLSESRAPWKVVGIYHPLVSLSPDPKVREDVAERLFPILDRNGVHLVLSSAEAVYQRIEDPAHKPVLIVAGWSGDVDDKHFPEDPRLKASYSQQEGFLLLEFRLNSLRLQARTREGHRVDERTIQRRDVEGQGGLPLAAQAGDVASTDTLEPGTGASTPEGEADRFEE